MHDLRRRDLRKEEMVQHRLGHAVNGYSSSMHPINPKDDLPQYLSEYQGDGGSLSVKNHWNKTKIRRAVQRGKPVVAHRMYVNDADGGESVMHDAYLKNSPQTSLTFGRTTRHAKYAAVAIDQYKPIQYRHSSENPPLTLEQLKEHPAVRHVVRGVVRKVRTQPIAYPSSSANSGLTVQQLRGHPAVQQVVQGVVRRVGTP
jgi:hypothetical protein